MSNPQSDREPTPVLPLSYYDGQTGPWVPVVRFMSWVSIVYAGIVITIEAATIGVMVLLGLFSHSRPISTGYLYFILLTVLPALPAVVLLGGGARSLRWHPSGRPLIVWASAALCACSLLSFVVSAVTYVSRYFSSNSVIAVSQMFSSLSELLFHIFVPAILWISFRRREIRDVFERA
jgi:hypothetical protein